MGHGQEGQLESDRFELSDDDLELVSGAGPVEEVLAAWHGAKQAILG